MKKRKVLPGFFLLAAVFGFLALAPAAWAASLGLGGSVGAVASPESGLYNPAALAPLSQAYFRYALSSKFIRWDLVPINNEVDLVYPSQIGNFSLNLLSDSSFSGIWAGLSYACPLMENLNVAFRGNYSQNSRRCVSFDLGVGGGILDKTLSWGLLLNNSRRPSSLLPQPAEGFTDVQLSLAWRPIPAILLTTQVIDLFSASKNSAVDLAANLQAGVEVCLRDISSLQFGLININSKNSANRGFSFGWRVEIFGRQFDYALIQYVGDAPVRTSHLIGLSFTL